MQSLEKIPPEDFLVVIVIGQGIDERRRKREQPQIASKGLTPSSLRTAVGNDY